MAVLANDSDPDGDALSVTEEADGAHGAAACTGAGSCAYTPDPDYHGSDSFTYTVTDGRGGSATATVAVDVTSVNDSPDPRVDVETVAENGALVLEPAANDQAGPGNEAGQTLTVRALSAPPSYGTATVSGSLVEYQPPADYSGPDWLDYEVCDDGETGGAADPRCAVGSVRLKIARVVASVETDPLPDAGDAADDAAVWVHPSDPTASTIIGTDKGGLEGVGGLAVYDLSGGQIQYVEGGKMNNVDLRGGFELGGGPATIVAASDRTNRRIALYRVDPSMGTLVDLHSPVSLGFEPYGLCMYRSGAGGKLYVFVTRRDTEGYVEQWELRQSGGGGVSAVKVRSFSVGSLSEGCVADDELGRLYVGEEKVGIWRYAAEPDGESGRVAVDVVGSGGHLAADVEGLAVAGRPDGAGYLLAASQGDGSYVVYRRGGSNEFVRSFTVEDGPLVDGTTGIDGIETATVALGPSFPHGVLVSQDGTNTSPAGPANQNFKLIPLELALGDGPPAGVGARPTSCPRPYSTSSPWNAPVAPSPVYHPQSDFHMTAFAGSRLSSDSGQFTYPVYEVTSSTPLQTVTLDGWYSNVTNGGATLTNQRAGTAQLPIPEGAAPAAGSDAQIILVDPVTGDEWGASNLERDASGNWTAWNAYHYNTAWSGVPPFASNGDPFFARGAGVPYLTGLVRPCELARGRIEHALAFAYDSPTHEFVYPATKSDGNAWDGVDDETDSHPGDVPEGTRLQLDPTLSVGEIQAWGCTGACLTIARALQEYGMYVIDNSARPKVMLEYEGTAGWNGVVGEDTVRPIPLSAFNVLAPSAP